MEIFDVVGKEELRRGNAIIIKLGGAYQVCDVIKGQGSPNIYFLTYTEEGNYEYINSSYFRPKNSFNGMMVLDSAKIESAAPEVREAINDCLVKE